ncbi:MAG: SIS domain-containing protein [Sphingobacteriales bacterium]|jgi:D-sedoheptulose 7-phosphate isomerase
MDKIKQCIEESIFVKETILNDEQFHSSLQKVIELTVKSLESGGRLWFCGNGGSAADAQHLAAEFSGRFYMDRRALPAEALHCNSSYLTAVANDYSYDDVYARLVEGVCSSQDILFGFSTSGNSTNICRAFTKAKEKNMLTIGFTGKSGGKLKECSDILFDVPSTNTPRIQEAHIMLGHIICQMVEEIFFKEG